MNTKVGQGTRSYFVDSIENVGVHYTRKMDLLIKKVGTSEPEPKSV